MVWLVLVVCTGKYSVTVRAALSRRSKSTLFSDLFKLKLRSTVGVRDIGVEKTQIYVGYINRKDSSKAAKCTLCEGVVVDDTMPT